MLRLTLAAVVVTLVAPALALLGGHRAGSQGALQLAGFTLLALVIVGLPLLALLLRRGWRSWRHFALAGGVLGAVCIVPFVGDELLLLLFLLPNFMVIGALHGLLFWMLGVAGNRDLSRFAVRVP